MEAIDSFLRQPETTTNIKLIKLNPLPTAVVKKDQAGSALLLERVLRANVTVPTKEHKTEKENRKKERNK